MADSIREQILAAFATRLQTITTANSYQTDLGGNVVRARRSFREEDLPAVSLIDGPETFDRAHGFTLVSMQVEVHALDNTTTPSTDASKMLADIYQCIQDWNLATDGLIDSIGYQKGGPEYPEDGSDIVKVVSLFLVKFNIVKGDPYTQP